MKRSLIIALTVMTLMALTGPAAAQVERETFDLADGAPTFHCGGRTIHITGGTGTFRVIEPGESGRVVGGFVGRGTAADEEGNSYRVHVNFRAAETRTGFWEKFNATFVGQRGEVHTWRYQAQYTPGEEPTSSEAGCRVDWGEDESSPEAA